MLLTSSLYKEAPSISYLFCRIMQYSQREHILKPSKVCKEFVLLTKKIFVIYITIWI